MWDEGVIIDPVSFCKEFEDFEQFIKSEVILNIKSEPGKYKYYVSKVSRGRCKNIADC